MNPIKACREALKKPNRNNAAHAGLLLNRYLCFPAEKDSDAFRNDRTSLHKAAKKAAVSGKLLYQLAFDTWEKAFTGTGVRKKLFKTQAGTRLIVGLGGHHVLETGLTLHHTYGTPVIPGTALKGLAAHYCHKVWGEADAGFKMERKFFNVLFGTQDEGGLIEFHDAWIHPDYLTGCLREDVMTPHHTKYYMADESELSPPSDFDDPVTVPFLSVAGSFLVVLSKRMQDLTDKYLDAAFQLVKEALAEWGIGGKTSSGYGRMEASA
jgi:CRISPR-associated protein Cmr6